MILILKRVREILQLKRYLITESFVPLFLIFQRENILIMLIFLPTKLILITKSFLWSDAGQS
ncbi:hypothetical protein MCHI_000487 [Candidatus Magnetoovum chiemensis]|nr:hypothetical protein MCHI_000487 [Candidatus Magnetoovum chiemensis]